MVSRSARQHKRQNQNKNIRDLKLKRFDIEGGSRGRFKSEQRLRINNAEPCHGQHISLPPFQPTGNSKAAVSSAAELQSAHSAQGSQRTHTSNIEQDLIEITSEEFARASQKILKREAPSPSAILTGQSPQGLVAKVATAPSRSLSWISNLSDMQYKPKQVRELRNTYKRDASGPGIIGTVWPLKALKAQRVIKALKVRKVHTAKTPCGTYLDVVPPGLVDPSVWEKIGVRMGQSQPRPLAATQGGYRAVKPRARNKTKDAG